MTVPPGVECQDEAGRLWDVLSGKDLSKPFAHLTAADRQAVVEIVRDTKKDLPADWKK